MAMNAAALVTTVVLLCVCVCRAALEDDGRWHISSAEDMASWFGTKQGQFWNSDAALDADIDFAKALTATGYKKRWDVCGVQWDV